MSTEVMEHKLRFGEGEIMEFIECHANFLLLSLSEEDVSLSEVMITNADDVQRIIDVLELHKARMR
jgi:hypothetical protein